MVTQENGMGIRWDISFVIKNKFKFLFILFIRSLLPAPYIVT